MAKKHANSSSGEASEENNQSKFRVLDGSNLDVNYSSDNSTEYGDQDADIDMHLSTEEQDFNFEEISTEEQHFSFEEMKNSIADIDTLYAKLSADFLANPQRSEQTSGGQTDDSDSSSESESKGNASDDSIIWSSDEEILDSDSDDNMEDRPIFEGSSVTYEEHLMAIMSLAVRHNLNQAQLSDLIEVLKLHSPKDGMCVNSGKSLYKEVTGDVEMQYHDVCELCFGLFPEDTSLYSCSTTGCSG